MYRHHEETVKKVIEVMSVNPNIIGLLLCGSICHGYASESSDVDIMIIVSEAEYSDRTMNGELTFYSTSLSTYKEGYVDGKYISKGYLKKVAKAGNEATRYAFDGAKILFSKDDQIDDLLNEITHYPENNKPENIKKFYAQLEAWKWYCEEALKQKNDYLLRHSVNKLILFGGRLLLAKNEKLFPYHKWFMRVLEDMNHKPDNLIELINTLLKEPNIQNVNGFYDGIKNYHQWDVDQLNWPNQFAKDSELHWLDGQTPVSDI